MKEQSLEAMLWLLKRLPPIAAERKILARSLRHVRRMEPKIARLLFRVERERRTDFAWRWMRETSKPEQNAAAYIRRAVLELKACRG